MPSAQADPTQLPSQLLLQAGKGDQQAFSEFYDLVSPMVFGIVVKIVRDPAQSEEVTQEVFLELWRFAARYDPSKGPAKTWAATLAHRRSVDRVRSAEATRKRDEQEAKHRPEPSDTVTDTIITRLDQQRVVTALDQLTASQREAVTLAYYGGHTYREVAALLGVPEGTIKTRIRDGLIKLRDFMEVPS